MSKDVRFWRLKSSHQILTVKVKRILFQRSRCRVCFFRNWSTSSLPGDSSSSFVRATAKFSAPLADSPKKSPSMDLIAELKSMNGRASLRRTKEVGEPETSKFYGHADTEKKESPTVFPLKTTSQSGTDDTPPTKAAPGTIAVTSKVNIGLYPREAQLLK